MRMAVTVGLRPAPGYTTDWGWLLAAWLFPVCGGLQWFEPEGVREIM